MLRLRPVAFLASVVLAASACTGASPSASAPAATAGASSAAASQPAQSCACLKSSRLRKVAFQGALLGLAGDRAPERIHPIGAYGVTRIRNLWFCPTNAGRKCPGTCIPKSRSYTAPDRRLRARLRGQEMPGNLLGLGGVTIP